MEIPGEGWPNRRWRKVGEVGAPLLKKNAKLLHGKGPDLCSPFYSSLKVRYSMDVGGKSRDGRVIIELGTGSLRQAVGILTPEDFQTIVDTDKASGSE